jgi:predicted dithiol-disulfide oxidoreductase (DUF899 family)
MSTGDNPPVASRDEWLAARKRLLKSEKALTRLRDLVSAERRNLPWLRIDEPYVFDTAEGRQTLADLFGGCSQLIVHHLMFHPDWEAACPGCTFQADHIDGPAAHLYQKDVRIVAVSRAPIAKLQAYRERMGWQFEWVSSLESDFNTDFAVSFPRAQIEKGTVDYNFGTIDVDPRYISEELPGISVFIKDPAGQVFHTYSTYARGLDELLTASHYLDLTPLGRNEAAHPNWPKRRYEYEPANAG